MRARHLAFTVPQAIGAPPKGFIAFGMGVWENTIRCEKWGNMIVPVQGKVGQTVTLEGYADDFGSHIVAVEFTLDGGTSWVSHSTEKSSPDLMVHWTFSWKPEEAGIYQLKVRSVTEDGRRSPEAAVTELYISE